MLVMYTSHTNHLGPSSGPTTADRAVLHATEIVPRDSRTGRCAVERFLKRHPVLDAHQVIQDRVRSGAEVVQAAAQRI